MDEKLLETREFTGIGYQPVVDFGAWRVAILNYIDEIHPARIEFMERHNETDEVFVLMKGKCILFIGEGEARVEKLQHQGLEPGKIYNVKKGIWHTTVLSLDGSILIVENQDTRRENSNYVALESEHRRQLLESAVQEMPGLWR